jgi:hypothetical protein
MRKFILCLSMIIASVFVVQAETLRVDNASTTNMAEDNYYIVSTVNVDLSSDFNFEANLTLYAGGSFSLNDISALISGDCRINGNYVKFSISTEVANMLARRKNDLLPIGRAGDGKIYYIKMYFVY